jgi:hypothetical protein
MVKQCHQPPMTGNGKHTTYKSGDDRGMVYDCFTLSIYIYTYIYIHLKFPLQ